MATCEFFYDFSSPYAYLASTQVERVFAGHHVVWRPFLLGALFKAIGTPMVPFESFAPAKQALMFKDQHRWAEHLGVEFRFPSIFPQRSLTALRVAIQAPPEKVARLSHELYRIAWVDDGDLEDKAALRAAIGRADLDAEALLAGAEQAPVKAALKASTDEAVARGLCGAPSFVINGIVFWGQDRMELARKALDGWVPRIDAGV